MEIKMINLGDADRELPTDVGNQWPHHRTLVLQRMHVTEPEVELDRARPHRHLAERTRPGWGPEHANVGTALPPAGRLSDMETRVWLQAVAITCDKDGSRRL